MGLEVKVQPHFSTEIVMSWKDTLEVRARQAGADYAVAHEKQLDSIVKQLQAVSIMWKDGDASELSGRVIKQFAVLKAGQTLTTGRNVYTSDKKFGDWLKTLKLEPPFDDRRERYAAMKIAALFSDEVRLVTQGTNDEDRRTSDEVNLVREKLSLCLTTRPNEILVWARRTGLIPRKKRNPEATAQARERVRAAVENGETIGRNQIAEELGAHNSTVDIAIGLERGRLEGIVEGEALALNEQGKFTKAQDKHVQALIKKHRRDLDVQFAAAVEAEVNKQVATRKASLARAQEACVKQKNDAFADQQRWKKLINNHKPPLTMEEFRAVVMALHPDNSASEETRARALQSVNEKKLQLTGKG